MQVELQPIPSRVDAGNSGSGKQLKVFVVRHAENVSPLQPNLSSKGSLQAQALAEIFKQVKSKNVKIISSQRSRETAQNIAHSIEGVGDVEIDERLRSWDCGVLAGLSKKEIKEQWPDLYQKRFVERIPSYKVKDAETLQDRFNRVKNFLDEIVAKYEGDKDVIIVVTHGSVIDDMYRVTSNMSIQPPLGLLKPYGCVSILIYENGKWRDEKWASASHLPHIIAESPTGGHLYLFPHQVAGSVPFFRGDRGELCKPAIKNELDVYNKINKEQVSILNFTPVFLGTVEIDVKHILTNRLSLMEPLIQMGEYSSKDMLYSPSTLPAKVNTSSMSILEHASLNSSSTTTTATTTTTTESTKRVKISTPRKKPDNNSNIKKQKLSTPERPILSSPLAHVPTGKTPFSVTNLWKRFTSGRWKKIIQNKETGRYLYLLLENFTHCLRRPYVMDLKIGTQQYSPDESAEKIKRKTERCKNTTSSSLGARVGGMKTYSKVEHRYILKDKYWGRSLDDDGFKEAMKDFVKSPDGTEKINKSVLNKIINQLKALREAAMHCNWRFYGSSLLIVYDSDPIVDDNNNSSPKSKSLSLNSDESNNESYVHTSKQIVTQRKQRSLSDGNFDFLENDPENVRVRLIDFSHCVTKDHGSYDAGFVFGIENLIKIFNLLQ